MNKNFIHTTVFFENSLGAGVFQIMFTTYNALWRASSLNLNAPHNFSRYATTRIPVDFRSVKLLNRVSGETLFDVLKKQDPSDCIHAHYQACKELGGIGLKVEFKDVSHEIPSKKMLIEAVKKSPCLFTAGNITDPNSKYIGFHSIILVEMSDDNKNVIIIDKDDSIKCKEPVFEVDVDELLNNAWLPNVVAYSGWPMQIAPVLSRPVGEL
jgi:hypothetical protein